MAGSATTFTEIIHGSVKLVKCAWTADDATGAVSGTSTEYYNGKILGLATVPGTGGTQPDDLYDVAVTDNNSLDVLMSAGANRDELNTEYVLSTSLGAVVESQLTVAVTNAGNSNTGTVYLYIR
jgi:hypothetical protein